MPAECVSMGVPIALGKAMSVLALRCCGLLRASSVQAWTLARAARQALSFAWAVILSCNREVFVGPARSSGMSFCVGQSHKDVLYQMHNKARFSVVLVFRKLAEVRSVIRQIHPCTISILPYFSSQCHIITCCCSCVEKIAKKDSPNTAVHESPPVASKMSRYSPNPEFTIFHFSKRSTTNIPSPNLDRNPWANHIPNPPLP